MRDAKRGVQLYVKRVFVMDNCAELIRWYAALYVGGQAESIEAGVSAAGAAIESGAAADLLERFVARTQELATA